MRLEVEEPGCRVAAALLVTSNNLNRKSQTPNKSRYSGVDLARWARRYGVGFAVNDRFREIDSIVLVLARGAVAAQELNVFEAYHAAMFDACWRDNGDVVSEAGRSALLMDAGIDPVPLLDLASSAAVDDIVRENAVKAHAAGAFGTPTFVFDGEIFFGNDRLEFLRERIAEAGMTRNTRTFGNGND